MKIRKKLAWILLACVLFNVFSAVPCRAGLLQNIGDFLSLGANTVRELQTAIEMAGGEVRSPGNFVF